ncbi:hypothetical protein KAV46_01765 [Candidatus Bathyarchaeota archaeon]|nr:hypothetical protein [Candidatus Bathyarchaeota archaeon]
MKEMSESVGTMQIFAYMVAMIPSVYFLYRIVREVIYYINRDDSDIL